ncbi:hypothetical protein ACFL2V_07720 [Pseudomonadota bacterium]
MLKVDDKPAFVDAYRASALKTICNFLCRCSLIFLMTATSLAYTAEPGFEFNFQPHSSAESPSDIRTTAGHWVPWVDTTVTGQTPFLTGRYGWGGSGGSPWQSPEVVKVAVDDGTGNFVDRYFYHMVVGSLADGFIQESYVETGYTSIRDGGSVMGSLCQSCIHSASGGDYDVTMSDNEVTSATSNAGNALGASVDSGNGTGNPERSMIVQLNNDGEMFMIFRKDSLLKKPIIYQSIDVYDSIEVVFEIDMSHMTYDDDTSSPIVTNTMHMFGDETPVASGLGIIPDGADFDRARDIQNEILSGGKFIWTEGDDTLESPGGADGTYTYASGTYDQTDTNWEAYFDAYDPTGNPWTIDDRKPTP